MIADYQTLSAEIQSWMGRTDSRLTGRIPLFVGMAENNIYYGSGEPGETGYIPALRSTVMELTTTVSASDGVATVPDDYLEARSLTVAGQRTGIEYMPPERFVVYSADPGGTTPLYYTVRGTEISLTPGYTGNLALSYYRKFEAVTDTHPSEPVIAEHGLVYLYLCLFHAATWARNAQLALSHLTLARNTICGINSQSALRRFPGPLRSRPRVQMP